MPKFSTPNLNYLVNDEDGIPHRYLDVDKAVSAAARTAFNTEKTTSVYIYTKGHPWTAGRPDDPPVGVLNIKVTFADWK
jgi:hypothetical protein